MTNKLFEIQPGWGAAARVGRLQWISQSRPGLLKLLSGFLLEEEAPGCWAWVHTAVVSDPKQVAELQETVNHALQSVSYILDPSLARSHPARGSRLASLPLSRLRRAAR